MSSLMYLLLSSALYGCATALAAREFRAILDDIVTSQLNVHLLRAEALGLRVRLMRRLLRAWPVSLVVFFLGLWQGLGMWPALVAGIIGYVLPRIILERLITSRENRIRAQMVDVCEALANTARAGLSLSQGLKTVSASQIREPMAGVLRKIVHDYQHGLPLPTSLGTARRRLAIESFSLFAAAIGVALERGGRLDEALLRISRSIQADESLSRTLRVKTASGRFAVTALGVFPPFFLMGSWALFPKLTEVLFVEERGQAVLAIAAGLVACSIYWAAEINKLKI